MSLWSELKRRNVIRVGAAYLVAAWLIVEATSLILDIYAAPDWVIKVLIALLVIAFPIALLFSWVFELTPDGLKRETDVQASASITAATAKRLDIITIVLVIAAVGFVVIDRYVREPAPMTNQSVETSAPAADEPAAASSTALEPSIAVLPFADMSPEKDQEYFSDGMAEELLHLLAKVRGLKVAARTSSFQFKGNNADISEVASKLGVDHVLEGSVRKAGNQIRVTAQLINARDGFHIWSETYDHKLEDILLVQDKISGQIVAALAEHLGVSLAPHAADNRGPTNAEAYDFYLRGNFAKHSRTPESLLQAIEFYKQSVALDPQLAPAWGGLARAANLSKDFFPPREAELEQLGENAVGKALALDPNEPQALALVAVQRFEGEHDFAAGLAAYESVVAADPSDTEAMSWLAQRYRTLGLMEKAEALNRRAYSLDPLSPRVVLGIVRILTMRGKFEEARAIAERALNELDGHQYAVLAMAEYHVFSNDLRDARATLDMIQPEHPHFIITQMLLLAIFGDMEGMQAAGDVLIQKLPPGHFGIAATESIAHYLLGELETANSKMKLARQRGFGTVLWWMFRPGTLTHVPTEGLRYIPNYIPWVADYPDIVRGFQTLGIDIVAEVRAAGMAATDGDGS